MKKIILFLTALLFNFILPTSTYSQDTWDGTFASSFTSGDGTETNPYIISSAEEWAHFCQLSLTDDFSDKYLKLASDLYFPSTLSNAPHVIHFNGTLDGDGYTIEFNKYHNGTNGDYGIANTALFGVLYGTIKNLSFVNILPSQGKYGMEWFVTLASKIEATGIVSNCYLRNGGNGRDGYSALVANENHGLIDNCYGLLTASAVKVGEVYRNYGTISNCHTQESNQYYTNNFFWSIYTTTGLVENCDKEVITLDEWKANIKDIPTTCHVRFINSALAPISLPRGSSLTLPVPEDSRYTFVQWYHKEEPQPSIITVNTDIALTAYWRRDILSQPTIADPSFMVQDLWDATFQWYKMDENAISYPSWQSTNKADNSTSSQDYSIQAKEGQHLTFSWSISSDAFDCLKIAVNGTTILTESGENTGCTIYPIPQTGTYSITVSYTKDDDDSEGDDMARIESLTLSYPDIPLVDATTYKLPLSYRTKGMSYYCVASYTDSSNQREHIISPNSYTSDIVTFPSTIIAEDHNTYGARWYLTEEGELHFFGTGAMPNYSYASSYPWYKYRELIRTVEIDEGVTTVSPEAFRSSYPLLSSISIASSVTSIGAYAFQGCSTLKDVYCYAESLPSIGNSIFTKDYLSNATLHVPTAVIEDFKTAEQWSYFHEIISLTPSQELQPCDTPVINIIDGDIVLTCGTPNANFHYKLSAADLSDKECTTKDKVSLSQGLRIIVYATAQGFKPSTTIETTLPITAGNYGDLNSDGKITISDITTLTQKMLTR